MRFAVTAALGLGVLLQAGGFVQKVQACEPMRRVESERPKCCRLTSETRWTEEGGDCCLLLTLASSNPVLDQDTSHDVGQTPSVVLGAGEVRIPAPARVHIAGWKALERGPPLPVPTASIVLLN